MAYATGEAAILTLIQAVTGFSTTNTSQSKWKMLNDGKATKYVILRPGKFVPKRVSMGVFVYTWTTVVQVWERYKTDGTSIANLITDVDAIRLKLDAYPHLGTGTDGAVRNSHILEGSDVMEMWTKGGGPQWIKQDITVEWTEEEDVNYAE